MVDSEESVRLEARVTGRVQGVFFRATTQREARHLDLTGWVANRSDGSVELVAEGTRSACEALLECCREGPAGARVDHVDAVWGAAAGTFSSFEVHF